MSAKNGRTNLTRRDFLRLGAAGAAGMGFNHSRGARCDSVILLWLQGGVSHLDTFDPKPEAPAEIRGPFKAIGTNVPGIQLCEQLPRLARIADRIAFVRSMHHAEGAHERGSHLMSSGWRLLRDSSISAGWPAAIRLDAEPADIRDVYGDTAIGRRCLAARRLVEAGARFVQVDEDGWDHHFRVFDALRNRLPAFDQAVSALIRDLADRGLLDRTMVVFATEFGRSPRINNDAGREHHPGVFSCFLVGGGVRGGQVVGASDARGESPARRPVTPEDLFQTIYTRLGVSGGLSADARFEAGCVIRELA